METKKNKFVLMQMPTCTANPNNGIYIDSFTTMQEAEKQMKELTAKIEIPLGFSEPYYYAVFVQEDFTTL